MDEGRTAVASIPSPRQRRQWLLPAGLSLILVFLTVNVLTGGPLVGADWRLREAVQIQASSAEWRWIAGPANLIANLGSSQVAIPALILTALAVAVRMRTVRPLLTAAVAVTLLLAVVIPAKILIGRPSPGLASVVPGGWGAFPSGHTTTASVCYFVAVLLLTPDPLARVRRPALGVVGAACFLVGVALVWRDYHWFTDVAAGWALAAIIVPLAFRLTGRLGRRG